MSADAGASTMCQEDSRVSVISSNNMCGVRISNPQPFDTGIWKIYVNELQYNGRYENDNKVDQNLKKNNIVLAIGLKF